LERLIARWTSTRERGAEALSLKQVAVILALYAKKIGRDLAEDPAIPGPMRPSQGA
jgi:hypothetical protein